LFSCYNYIDKERIGNFLQKAVMKGINVVVSMFSNASAYSCPKGEFIMPIEVGQYDN
jgi:hypothetical protein